MQPTFTFASFAVIPKTCLTFGLLDVQTFVAALDVHTNLQLGVTGSLAGFTLVNVDALAGSLVLLVTDATAVGRR